MTLSNLQILENEKKWEDLGDEILEVGLLVSEKIFDDLVVEAVKDFEKIQHKNKQRFN